MSVRALGGALAGSDKGRQPDRRDDAQRTTQTRVAQSAAGPARVH